MPLQEMIPSSFYALKVEKCGSMWRVELLSQASIVEEGLGPWHPERDVALREVMVGIQIPLVLVLHLVHLYPINLAP